MLQGKKLVGGRVNWYGERQILFKQEKVIEYLFCPNHDGTYKNTWELIPPEITPNNNSYHSKSNSARQKILLELLSTSRPPASLTLRWSSSARFSNQIIPCWFILTQDAPLELALYQSHSPHFKHFHTSCFSLIFMLH